jgi:CRISPR system Cascade subunit CasC
MFIELHLIQNFAPSNLNRDDTNSPKDCTFGGFRRARISSQCMKRAIRHEPSFKTALKDHVGIRTKRVHERLAQHLVAKGHAASDVAPRVQRALEAVGFKWDEDKTAVLLFVSEQEVERWADVIHTHFDLLAAAAPPAAVVEEGEKKKPKTSKAQKAEKAQNLDALVKDLKAAMKLAPSDAVDVALFGRMVAENTDMSVDASCQVAHAISTHAVQIEMDFFTAVDDLQPKADTGAGMMGVIEFNSACFYRYAVIDTAQLGANLGADERLVADAVLAACAAAVSAIPSGKQNGFAAQNPPDWIRVEVRDGQGPRSLVNAFAEPIRTHRGATDLVGMSIEKAEAYAQHMADMLGDAPPRYLGTASTRVTGATLPKVWLGLEAALTGAA